MENSKINVNDFYTFNDSVFSEGSENNLLQQLSICLAQVRWQKKFLSLVPSIKFSFQQKFIFTLAQTSENPVTFLISLVNE